MPDIIRTGGISEMKKIATMAEAFFVPISPHDATGPITLIAGAQTMMSVPNFFRLEIAYSELELYQKVMDPPFDVHDGFFHVSTRPGLGHERIISSKSCHFDVRAQASGQVKRAQRPVGDERQA
jgi:galactonate dehydratase